MTGVSGFIALSGAGGHLGRQVLSTLLELVPAGQIIACTRKPELLGEFASKGIDVRHADFNDPATLPAAFKGASRLLIISTGDYDEIYKGRRIIQHRAAIDAALKAGVRHIIYTSCPNAGRTDVEDNVIRDHGLTEAALSASGAGWTALRNNLYMEGVADFLKSFLAGRQVLVPENAGNPCWVSRSDCARTAAFVLSGKADISGAADVTGPESIGLEGLARRWSWFNKNKIQVLVLPGEEVIKRLADNGMPSESARGLVSSAVSFGTRFETPVSDTVEKATGKAPESADSLLKNLPME